VNGKFVEISFAKAFDLIFDKIKSVKSDQNAFFAGAGLTNEEQYLIQKLARVGAKTNNISSFHYMGGATGYTADSISNVPFDAIKGASAVYLVGSEINRNNPVVGYMLNSARIPYTVISTNRNSTLKHKSTRFEHIKSYYHFVKAINHYLLSKDKQNMMFINDNCTGFEEYKKKLLTEDYKNLCKLACDCEGKCIEEIAESFNTELNAIMIFSEKEVTSETASEIINLALITGKLGKTSSGIIALKQKNNSHGLFDMGVRPKTGVGLQNLSNPEFVSKMKSKWGVNDFPKVVEECFTERFEKGEYKNYFIFGEDPIGCAVDYKSFEQIFVKADFIVVQDVFMSETAKLADLILPASLWLEAGGSFTNSQRMIQVFESTLKPKVELSTPEQLIKLLAKFGSNGISDIQEANIEALSLLPTNGEMAKYDFVDSESETSEQMFAHGCNYIMKRFDEEFASALGN